MGKRPKFAAFVLMYILCAGVILVVGFFPVIALAGHSGRLSGVAAALAWVAYGLGICIGPWPIVRLIWWRCVADRVVGGQRE